MIGATQAHIDLAALQHNFSIAKQHATNANVLAIIKANAYGHGMVRVAKALKNADGFGVATLDEGLRLRESGIIEQPILVLQGVLNAKELVVAVNANLSIVIHHPLHLPLLLLPLAEKLPGLWFKVNTGMGRLGFGLQDYAPYLHQLIANPNFTQRVILMSHLANADKLNNEHTVEQIKCFAQIYTPLHAKNTLPASLANSAGLLKWPHSHYDWVRPGVMLYGVSAISGQVGEQFGLKPVMRLTSRLIAVNTINAGDKVGYGSGWTAPQSGLIGVASIGYGDGYPHSITSGTPVLIQNRLYPIVGRVSMDMLCIDLQDHSSIQVGDTVTLWGDPQLPIETIAESAGTIPYELLCQISRRVYVTE